MGFGTEFSKLSGYKLTFQTYHTEKIWSTERGKKQKANANAKGSNSKRLILIEIDPSSTIKISYIEKTVSQPSGFNSSGSHVVSKREIQQRTFHFDPKRRMKRP